jgi:acetylornithine/N-succinyldiaminopimelate aminotransferase
MLGLKCRLPAAEVMKAGFAEELITVPAADNVVRLLPPLTLTTEEAEEALRRLDRAADAARAAARAA